MNALLPGNADLTERLEKVIARLGYNASGSLLRRIEDLPGSSNHHVVQQAFDVVDVAAVFGFRSDDGPRGSRFTPIVYLAAASDADEARAIHRLVWSQGVVPLLLVATPTGVEVRRSLAPPPDKPLTISWDHLHAEALPIEFTSLTAVALRSSIVWQDFSVDRSRRVDKTLLDGIVQLSGTVASKEGGSLDQSVLHAVIGKFLYLYVLLDRNIVDPAWIAALTGDNEEPLCATIASALSSADGSHVVWPAREVWALFDQIDGVMNGTVFPVSDAQRASVSEVSLHLIHRVIRHGDRVGPEGRQLSFLDVTFSTLRTETISAIYELFLSLESADEQADDGAFYTPPFLVDYVLDQVDRVRMFERSSRVLDPAAGSGIFLVGAFRRIIERALPRGKWNARQFLAARRILEQSIFGIERNPQAANVCRFSLYLTLLDYMAGASIASLQRMTGEERVFPRLSDNIRTSDVFAQQGADDAPVDRFSHVVGNPPWGSFGDSATRTNEPREVERQERIRNAMAPAIEYYETLDAADYPVSNKRLSELFIWKIREDFLAHKGALGILISTRSFVSRSASAFPHAFAKHFRIAGVANLSHFRYRLFAGARSPTIALFARNEAPDPMDQVQVYSPLLSSQPIGETGHLWSIIVNSSDVETHRLRDLTRTAEGWFDHLVLRPLDRRYARHIRAWNARSSGSLGRFLETSGLAMLRGGSPAQTGLPDDLLLKSGNYRQKLGLDGLGFTSYPHSALANYQLPGRYAQLFGGNVLLIPRSMNDFVVVREPVAFSSTFNAIFFEKNNGGRGAAELLEAIAAYLKSDAAYYFFAITGRSWILDHSRLEKNDLLTIPFPFHARDHDAITLLRSSDQKKITNLVANRLGLDTFFESCVHEYSSFRRGYEDSQMPQAGLNAPRPEETKHYTQMLSQQLQQNFGSRAKAGLAIETDVNDGHFYRVFVRVGRKDEADVPTIDQVTPPTTALSQQFNPYSTISYDPITEIVTITKPWTHVAWTIEQAFSDAQGVSSTIFRAGASG